MNSKRRVWKKASVVSSDNCWAVIAGLYANLLLFRRFRSAAVCTRGLSTAREGLDTIFSLVTLFKIIPDLNF